MTGNKAPDSQHPLSWAKMIKAEDNSSSGTKQGKNGNSGRSISRPKGFNEYYSNSFAAVLLALDEFLSLIGFSLKLST